jgi:hypothetical protein
MSLNSYMFHKLAWTVDQTYIYACIYNSVNFISVQSYKKASYDIQP